MVLEQHYLGCLAHASYFIADEQSGVAAVVDPQRDIGRYLEAAQRTGSRIRHVFLTHFHADFLAGHLEMRDQLGATIHLGPGAKAEYAFVEQADGSSVDLGPEVRVSVLATPGHSPESISLLVYDLTKDPDNPYAVLTGDTLFVGDVGRPDLRASLGWTAEELGSLLYDSLREKLLPLPDTTLVYPAHGPGTLCGRNLSSETVSTIGAQRAENYALAPMARDEFIRIVTADQPEAPSYFTYDAVLNTQERPTLTESLERELRPLSVDDVLALQRDGAQLLDTRPLEQFEAAHLRGSVNIGLGGSYATWCGTVLDRERPLVIIADPGREQESTLRLGRIGFDHVAGYLEGGIAVLETRPELVSSIERLAPSALTERLAADDRPLLIDVRAEGEFALDAIQGAVNMPLAHLRESLDDLRVDQPAVVYCSGGYRSAIAASMLAADGYERVSDLAGGLAAWEAAA
jgi:glyoxylase-like metal-dependent hydrolase (beta-lactamase superfamily II)/rhodanese-related sulfurtransferase